MEKQIKIVLRPIDETFAENLRELRQVQHNVRFVEVVRDGLASEAHFVPRLLPDGWFEVDGWRHPLVELEKVTVYLTIPRPAVDEVVAQGWKGVTRNGSSIVGTVLATGPEEARAEVERQLSKPGREGTFLLWKGQGRCVACAADSTKIYSEAD